MSSSATSTAFLSTVEMWVERFGECLALFRYNASAGNKDFELFDSFAAFQRRIETLSFQTEVIVFRGKLLPVRGVINPELMVRACDLVAEGEEWLAVLLMPRVAGRMSWYHHAEGMTHTELRAELEEYPGELVAVGKSPYWLTDSEDVVSGIVPDEDGAVVVGVY
jgi:hypothetical protein